MHSLNVFAKNRQIIHDRSKGVAHIKKKSQLKTQNGEGSTAKRNQRRRNKKE